MNCATVVMMLLLAVAAAANDVPDVMSQKPSAADRFLRVTGTIEPESMVEISARVSGIVAEFGPDPREKDDAEYRGKRIDYTTPVDVGTVLARLDDRTFRARLELERASLKRAEAELAIARSKSDVAKAQLQRFEALSKANSATPEQCAECQAQYDQSVAAVAVAEAAVEQVRITLQQAELDLENTVIHSPIKGTIIDRRINVGDRVTSDAKESTLFLISDLSRMQLWAAVNESDIGRIHVHQPVRFTTDAFPHDLFAGQVKKVRLNALSQRDLVVYTVEISLDEKVAAKLLPYLTAHVAIDTGADEPGQKP